MFERNKSRQHRRADRRRHRGGLEDGRVLKGKVAIPMSKSIYDVLNGTSMFSSSSRSTASASSSPSRRCERSRCCRSGVARTSARACATWTVSIRMTILGLSRGAAWDEVKAAYHRLAKVYHPDRYSAAELPAEVRDYLAVDGASHQRRLCRAGGAATGRASRPPRPARRRSTRRRPGSDAQAAYYAFPLAGCLPLPASFARMARPVPAPEHDDYGSRRSRDVAQAEQRPDDGRHGHVPTAPPCGRSS